MSEPVVEGGDVRLLLLGDSAVGKSSLLLRFCEDPFESNFVITIGVDYKVRTLQLDGKLLRLQVWDTAGQERFRTITPAYYRRAMGVLVIFDITNRKSFDNVEYWLRNLEDHGDSKVRRVLVGNKSDLSGRRKVSTEEATGLAQRHGMPYFEVSAKDSINVEKVFQSVAKAVAETHKLEISNTRQKSSVGSRPSGDNSTSSKCC
jgi:Ras-related protein Rab-8A